MTTQYPHTIAWFEVPVTNIGRATTFFETVFDTSLEKMEMEGMKMAVFPSPKENQFTVHGALVEMDGFKPADNGTLIYFYAGDDLSTPLSRVEAAGGKIIQEKTEIGQYGFMARFQDTEGNVLAMHSMK